MTTKYKHNDTRLGISGMFRAVQWFTDGRYLINKPLWPEPRISLRVRQISDLNVTSRHLVERH